MLNYADKYQAGAITNSMMEAAESCGFKFWALYINRARLESEYKKVLDPLSLGVLVHNFIERFPNGLGQISPVNAVLSEVADWGMNMDQISIFPRYEDAVAATLADGIRKNRTYTAPTWTNYWKTNFSQLDAEIAEFNAAFSRPDWICDIKPVDFLIRAITCVKNYNALLPEIQQGGILHSTEETFHIPYNGVILAGTMDRTDVNPETRKYIITDWKTGNKKYTSTIVHNLNQLNLYTLALGPDQVEGKRIVNLERKEITYVPFVYEPYRIYVENRLPRLIENVKTLNQTPKELLPVCAGRSFNLDCPCPLASLPADHELRCNAVYVES